MKKIVGIFVVILMVFSLSACGGNVKDVNIVDVDSDIYTNEDIQSAIDVIVKEFDRSWSGCTLKEISYAGDEISKEYNEWAERHDADEVIVLLSSFDVDSSGGDGSLEPNMTYTDWNWILVRDSGSKWKHVDHGY